jgi:hypothetical protein
MPLNLTPAAALISDPDLYVVIASPPSAFSYGCEESQRI